MCYAIPGRIIRIDGNVASVDYFGEIKKCLLDIDFSVGEYVYAQGGVVVKGIEEREAVKTLDFWRKKFFELKGVDAKNAQTTAKSNDENILALLQKVNVGIPFEKGDLGEIWDCNDDQSIKLILETANNVRQKENDNSCCVHGIIEFSNICKEGCSFCGINKDTKIERYSMSVEELKTALNKAVHEYGFKAIVLQTGENDIYSMDELEAIVKHIRKLGALVFLSLGERPAADYRRLYDAGARAALLRFETGNEHIYHKLKCGRSLKKRLGLIEELKSIGYILATGFLLGLPEEDDNDLLNNIMLTKKINPDMVSFGPFIPTKGTTLENAVSCKPKDILKVIAMLRFAMRNSRILVTSAMETMQKSLLKEGLLAGANSLMINVTPYEFGRFYKIYDGKSDHILDVNKKISDVTNLLIGIGRAPVDLGV